MRGMWRGLRVLFGIGAMQTVFVLHVNHLPGTEHLGDQEAAGVGPLRWNPAGGWIGLPQLVGRHTLADHGAPLHQIMRQRGEAFRLEERNPVFRQKVMQHLGVLPRHGGAEYGHYANWQAKIDGQAVDVAGARAGAGPDHLVAREDSRRFRR